MKGSTLSWKSIAYISCRLSWIYHTLRLNKSRIQYKLLEYMPAAKTTCIFRGIETSTLSITGTKKHQLIFGRDRSLIRLKTMAHITGFHDVIPS